VPGVGVPLEQRSGHPLGAARHHNGCWRRTLSPLLSRPHVVPCVLQISSSLWKMALRFRFRLPPYYTLVLRSLASLEGTSRLPGRGSGLRGEQQRVSSGCVQFRAFTVTSEDLHCVTWPFRCGHHSGPQVPGVCVRVPLRGPPTAHRQLPLLPEGAARRESLAP